MLGEQWTPRSSWGERPQQSKALKAQLLGGSVAKNLPAMQETWVQSLGGEDPLEKEIATHSNILTWRIPWTEKSGWLQSTESKESGTTERLTVS